MKNDIFQRIDAFIARERGNIIRDISRLVAVPSVAGKPAEGAPFGPGPKAALEKILEIAREKGLETQLYDDRMGAALLGGEGLPYLATITHVDVVDTGDGWTGDPFTVREREGYLIGRGVTDDKGPSILCLYLLQFLKEENIELAYPIRTLFGSDEETGMGDVKHYLKHYPAPAFCISPDADFPLIYGEKGIYQGTLRSRPVKDGNVLELNGGYAFNAIPDKATALVRAEGLQDAPRVTVEEKEPGVWAITTSGIGGHASLPKGKISANAVLVKYLLDNHIPSEEEEAFFELCAKVHESFDGSGVGIRCRDELFGDLTLVGGRLFKDGDCLVQSVDSRYPTAISGEKISRALARLAGKTAEVTTLEDKEPFYVDPSGAEVKACMAAYNEVTGEAAQPFTIGGGTYARKFPRAVAFGPEHPERPRPDFFGNIHGADEAASIEELLEALKVYIVAFLNLERLDF